MPNATVVFLVRFADGNRDQSGNEIIRGWGPKFRIQISNSKNGVINTVQNTVGHLLLVFF